MFSFKIIQHIVFFWFFWYFCYFRSGGISRWHVALETPPDLKYQKCQTNNKNTMFWVIVGENIVFVWYFCYTILYYSVRYYSILSSVILYYAVLYNTILCYLKASPLPPAPLLCGSWKLFRFARLRGFADVVSHA